MPSDTVNQLIWVAFLVGIPLALAVHYLGDARRANAMTAAAKRLRLGFTATDTTLKNLALMRLPIFRVGESPSFRNVLRGQMSGRDVLVFDYRHRVGGLLTSMTHNSLVADAVIGIEKNRKPTWYNMTVVALQAPPVAEPSRKRVPDMPGGHTRVERGDEWLAFYRFDRRVPIAQLPMFVRSAIKAAERAEHEA
jgi:hypothetical protein